MNELEQNYKKKAEAVMTDKQIIIDGVDVSGCERHCSDNYNTPNMCYSDMTRGYRQCNPKENQCDFYIVSIEKQLARKTQECEELKKQLDEQVKTASSRYSELNTAWNNRCKKYDDDLKQLARCRKALDEIEEIIDNDDWRYCPLDNREDCHGNTYLKILDIISKAKGASDNER